MTDNYHDKSTDENKKTSWLQFIERRLLGTLKNSLVDLNIAFKNEEAFKVEVLLAAIALPAIYWVAESVMEGLLPLMVTPLILVTELLNSDVEAPVDRAGLDCHEFSKKGERYRRRRRIDFIVVGCRNLGSIHFYLKLQSIILIAATRKVKPPAIKLHINKMFKNDIPQEIIDTPYP